MDDTFRTIADKAEAIYKEKGSKFLCYAYPVENQDQIAEILEELRKKYYDATHHCYAWRLGAKGELSRANDDGEPSSTAGKPILGQLLSYELTNVLIVVIRYFGGTKLGVGGLITAYKESAQCAIEASVIEDRTVDVRFDVEFSYFVMNDVMKAIKELQPMVLAQNFDNLCTITLSIRKSKEEALTKRFEDIDGVSLTVIDI